MKSQTAQKLKGATYRIFQMHDERDTHDKGVKIKCAENKRGANFNVNKVYIEGKNIL